MQPCRAAPRVLEEDDRLEFAGQVLVVGGSPALRRAVEDLRLAARHPVNVLIEGESGTGKELLSRLLHTWSARAQRPFVAINCAGLPGDLLENELFGHRRGAYTHAHEDRKGLLAEADGGTLFLDELAGTSASLQPKLLRFLDSGEYRRVGEDCTRRADLRVVAASNRPLAAEVAAGRFRPDLFFRLSTLTVEAPPLRHRRGDIPALVAHLLASLSRELGLEPPRLSAAAMDDLCSAPWPGNVRELRNVLTTLTLRSAGCRVDRVVLPESPSPESNGRITSKPFQQAKQEAVDRFERAYLDELLAEHGGNVSRAARAAGKHRRALHALLGRHRVDAGRYRA